MKNSTHLSRQQSLARSNRQLQLTDNLYKIQPQKSVQINTSAAFSAFKDIISTVPSIAETTERAAIATEFVKPPPPSIAPPPTPNHSTQQLSSLFQIKASNVKSVKSVESHLNASILQVSRSNDGGRLSAKNQPKRLQRNRVQVSSKPSNYALRSQYAAQSVYQEICASPVVRTPRTPAQPLNRAKLIEKPANYEFDFVDCAAKENTPVTVKHFEKKFESAAASKPTPINRIKLEPIQQNQTPSSQLSNIAKKIQQNQQQSAEVPQQTPSSNRFSFSKLTKFVSQSALKVINRRSTGGGSNGSSPDTTASFSSTSMITDDEDSKIESSEKQQTENFYFDCVPIVSRPEQTKPQFQPLQQVQQQSAYNDCIYKSFEQYKEIESKINKSSLSRMRSNASSASREQPTMGVTSIMLKQYKRSNQTASTNNSSAAMSMYQYGMTTGMGTSACLIGAPIVINSATFKKQESSFKSNSMSVQQDSVYDHLNQKPAFIGETIDIKHSSSSKKIVKPVVKSVASLSYPSSAPSKNLTPAKLSSYNCSKSVSKFTAKKVEQELLYESFNDSVF
jgi:hypothetical protein